MNIVWLDINSSYSHSSLALAAIEANKRCDKNSWDSVNGTINSDIFEIVMELYNKKPEVIAATLWLFNHEVVMKIIARIKSLMPKVVIILGGPEFNGDNSNFLMTHPQVNAVFRGEGEVMFHNWLESYKNSENWGKIDGLCYIDKHNNYQDNGRARVADFPALKYPEESRFFNKKSPFVQLETSRGCFNSCSFCTSGGDTPIRSLSIEEIEKRVKYISNLGIKEFRLLDRTFNYSATRATAMLELFKEYPNSNFHLEIHPALLKSSKLKECLKGMPDGIIHIEAGLQSLDDNVLKASGRRGDSEDAIEGVKFLCAQTNFETHTDLIAGLPNYSLEQIFSDIITLSKIKAGEIQLELLKLLPGTKMREDANKLGIKFGDDTPYEVLESDAMTTSDLFLSKLLSKLVDKFYNAKGWQKITQTLINENQNFLKEFFEFMLKTELLNQPLSLEKRGILLYSFCKEKYPSYLTQISLQWIFNGMSLKREEAGKLTKIKEGMEIIESIDNYDSNIRYYNLCNSNNKECYIIGFNRSQEHSKPIYCQELKGTSKF